MDLSVQPILVGYPGGLLSYISFYIHCKSCLQSIKKLHAVSTTLQSHFTQSSKVRQYKNLIQGEHYDGLIK